MGRAPNNRICYLRSTLVLAGRDSGDGHWPQGDCLIAFQARHARPRIYWEAKNLMNGKRPPPAPPIYRPCLIPKALQAKMETRPSSDVRRLPAAPPVYRPRLVPEAPQTKTERGNLFGAGQVPAAPPVYRPCLIPKALQAKAASSGSIGRGGQPRVVPPIRVPLPAPATQAPAIRRAPPVFRPPSSAKALQRMERDVTFFNAQGAGENNRRKHRQVETAVRLGTVTFVSEVRADFVPPAGTMVVDAASGGPPTGTLNYLLPTAAQKVNPAIPGDAQGLLAAKGWRQTTYEGLWGRSAHPRYPFYLGTVNGVRLYGIHSKSAPNTAQKYALASMVLHLDDINPGHDWALVGDLNLEPHTLMDCVNELRPGAAANLFFKGLGQATHRGGKELDFVVGTVDADVEPISRDNLRGGSDHKGLSANFL